MGMFSSVGGLINDLTGATTAGAQSQKYALQSAVINNKYQKEFAQNAHQWEVQDLQKAGLNPILSAGGSGASASGGGVANGSVTGGGSASISPMDAIGAGVSAYQGIQNAKQIKAQTANLDANTLLTKAKTQMQLLDNAIKMKASPAIIAKYEADLAKTQEEVTKLKGGAVTGIAGTELGGKLSKGWNYLTGLITGEN